LCWLPEAIRQRGACPRGGGGESAAEEPAAAPSPSRQSWRPPSIIGDLPFGSPIVVPEQSMGRDRRLATSSQCLATSNMLANTLVTVMVYCTNKRRLPWFLVDLHGRICENALLIWFTKIPSCFGKPCTGPLGDRLVCSAYHTSKQQTSAT
jgi:hypothetical protein